MKQNLFIVLLGLFFSSCHAQQPEQKIKWMSFEEAVAKSDKEPRKLFIDVYTHWCGWCKKMDASTFMNDTIADYINKYFYAVKLNAETKDTLHFRDKIFVYKPEYKANELALSLLNGKMGYPTYVLLDEKFGMLAPHSGYMQANYLMEILKFYNENIYLTKKWEDYQKEALKQ